jgi:alpha-tubulin suppressor-like RCC1 family protein
MGDALAAVDLGTGKIALAISAGNQYSCALLEGGEVKCWGSNANGCLGLGDTMPRGSLPGQMGDALPSVSLGMGKPAIAVGASFSMFGDENHTCAVLQGGAVKCWGVNTYGQLGLGDTTTHGDEPGEMGDALPSVSLW